MGAQRSSDRPSSDAYTNLVSAARFIAEADAAGVFVLMHETSSDTAGAVHLGTKVRKMHTSRRDAFQSVNCRPVARIGFEGGDRVPGRPSEESRGQCDAQGMPWRKGGIAAVLPGHVPIGVRVGARSHHGVVFAGSGLGHVSTDMVEAIGKAIKAGTQVVMTSQCLYGRVNLNVYDTGRDLITAGVIPARGHAARDRLVKLMWVLGQTSDD